MTGLRSYQDVNTCDVCLRPYLSSNKWGRCPEHEHIDELPDEDEPEQPDEQ